MLYFIAENNAQQQCGSNSVNNSLNHTSILKEALLNIPSPTTEIITRNVASKIARAYLEKVSVSPVLIFEQVPQLQIFRFIIRYHFEIFFLH